jgi:hypothetical protein
LGLGLGFVRRTGARSRRVRLLRSRRRYAEMKRCYFIRGPRGARLARAKLVNPLITGDFSVFRRESQSHLGRSSYPAKTSRSAWSGAAAEQQVKLVALPRNQKKASKFKSLLAFAILSSILEHFQG